MSPTTLETHAAWILVATFAISLVYELWRVKVGTTKHDSLKNFLSFGIVLYGGGAVIIWLLFAGVGGAAWIALVFSVVLILVSILYYNPVVMREREPGLIDWVEDLVYTGLLFVVAALLTYEVTGWALQAG